MSRIFKNAKFGDRFLTKLGNKAIYVGYNKQLKLHRLVVNGSTEVATYSPDAWCKDDGENIYDNDNPIIVKQ